MFFFLPPLHFSLYLPLFLLLNLFFLLSYLISLSFFPFFSFLPNIIFLYSILKLCLSCLILFFLNCQSYIAPSHYKTKYSFLYSRTRYPTLGTRFVHTSEGKFLVTRLVPCPVCLECHGQHEGPGNHPQARHLPDNWGSFVEMNPLYCSMTASQISQVTLH